KKLGDARAYAVVKLVEHDVVFGCVRHRVHDVRRHERGGHRRVGAGCVDERAHAELAKIIAWGGRGRSIWKKGARGFSRAADERHARDDFKKTSSTPHGRPPDQRGGLAPSARVRMCPGPSRRMAESRFFTGSTPRVQDRESFAAPAAARRASRAAPRS